MITRDRTAVRFKVAPPAPLDGCFPGQPHAYFLNETLYLNTDEKRHPRGRFTKQLGRICRALDEVSVRDISYQTYGTPATCHLVADQLWVVGSYARGALTCGDLDIVVNFTATGAGLPIPTILFRTFFGATPGVRFYSGTPDMNMSGAVFPDAVLIWSAQDPDWQARIDSIEPDAAAGRASRDTDTIPLRAEQMKVPECTLADVARWKRDGVFEWDFFPLNDARVSDIPTKDIGSKEARLFECARSLGRKTQYLIPVLWRVMRETEPEGSWATAANEGATLKCGGALIYVGTPALVLKHFENKKVTQLMLVPHKTARGPNGAWLIRRGPNHPLRLGLQKCSVFYVGSLDVLTTPRAQPEPVDAGIELLDLKSHANDTLKKMKLTTSKPLQVIHVQGFELYDFIGRAELIRHGDKLISPALGKCRS